MTVATEVPASAAERWLAAEVLTADALRAVAEGDLDGAHSRLAAGCRTVHADAVRWSTGDGKVTYSHPEHGQGAITLRRLVRLADSARSDAKAERLHTAYRAYVHEAVEQAVDYPADHGMIGPLDEATTEQLAAAEAHSARYGKVSRALDAAARAWWDAPQLPASDPDIEAVAVAGDGLKGRAAVDARLSAAAALPGDRLHRALCRVRHWAACDRRDQTRRALLREGRRRAFDAALSRLAAADTLAELTSTRVRYASTDADDATNGCGVFRESIWAAEHDALYALRRAEIEHDTRSEFTR